MKIRKLKVRDSRAFLKILKKLIVDTKAKWIETLIQSSGESGSKESVDGEEKYVKLFSDIITLAIDNFESDVTELFADLCGLSVEEYLDLDGFDTDIEVIEEIKKDESFKSFFLKAWVAVKSQNWFANITNAMKEKYDSLTSLVQDNSKN